MSDPLADLQRVATLGLYDAIAQEICKDERQLRCEKCGRVQELTASHVSVNLAHGWPFCCGYTMTMEKRKHERSPD